MSDASFSRVELAACPTSRVELDPDGSLHVISGNTTLRLDQATCEDLATTLARAVIALSKRQSEPRSTRLRLVTASAGNGTSIER
jgi:hypothetical protein